VQDPKSIAERDARLDSIKASLLRLAHDVNNSLVPILGYSTLIKEEIPAGTKSEKHLKSLESAVVKAQELVEKILLATKPQRKYKLEDCDFSILLNERMELFPAVSGAASPVLTCNFKPFIRRLDTVLWSKAIEQLLLNAREGLATGGEIRLQLDKVEIHAEFAKELGVDPGIFASLTIYQTASSIVPDVLDHAFEPFFSTHGKGKSKGLGLTIVHSVARFHGGQVYMGNVQGGVQVTVLIPSWNVIPEPISMSDFFAPTSAPQTK